MQRAYAAARYLQMVKVSTSRPRTPWLPTGQRILYADPNDGNGYKNRLDWDGKGTWWRWKSIYNRSSCLNIN